MREGVGRTGLKQAGVVVVVGMRHAHAIATVSGLAEHVVDIDLAIGAVVVPVVAHPAVDHGAFRSGHFERGMRIEQCHDDGEALVAGADHADAAVRLGHVLDQPVDGVPGVGGVVGAGGVIARSDRRRRHVVGALGAVLAANILIDANIAGLDKNFVGERKSLDHARTLGARGAAGGVVGSAGEQNGRILRSLGDDNDGVELDAVAHGNHHYALVEIGRLRGSLEVGVELVKRKIRLLRGGSEGARCEESENGVRFHVSLGPARVGPAMEG